MIYVRGQPEDYDEWSELGATGWDWSTMLPAFKAIGVPELLAHLTGDLTLDEAREAVTVSTRQFAKRQRTWFRSKMATWTWIDPRN